MKPQPTGHGALIQECFNAGAKRIELIHLGSEAAYPGIYVCAERGYWLQDESAFETTVTAALERLLDALRGRQ